MAQAIDLPTTSRFHNLSNAALPWLGHADAVLKGAEAEARRSRTKSSGADCLRPPATASPSGPIPCLQAVCMITVSLTGKTLPLARSRAISYAGHSVILITFVAKTAMFDNGVTQCPCP